MAMEKRFKVTIYASVLPFSELRRLQPTRQQKQGRFVQGKTEGRSALKRSPFTGSFLTKNFVSQHCLKIKKVSSHHHTFTSNFCLILEKKSHTAVIASFLSKWKFQWYPDFCGKDCLIRMMWHCPDKVSFSLKSRCHDSSLESYLYYPSHM